jgi:hypothetical protein
MVEADIKGLFANLAHEGLWKMLALRIDDKPFLGLIQQWRKAGILDTDGQILYPEEGSPQGGSLSPVRANGYLPYAVDLWFEKVVKTHCQGEALSCRYADDFVCAFRYRAEAERFFRELPKRLNKFGLDVAPDKPRILRVSRFHPSMKRRFVFLEAVGKPLIERFRSILNQRISLRARVFSNSLLKKVHRLYLSSRAMRFSMRILISARIKIDSMRNAMRAHREYA